MGATLLGPGTDLSDWVTKHEVCWELELLHESVKGRGTQQTGYALGLFGRLDPAAQDDDEALALRIYEGLRALALDALRALPSQAMVEVQPFGRTVLPAEPRFTLEVELTVIGSPAHPDDPTSAADTQRDMALLEAKLRSMGLPRRK